MKPLVFTRVLSITYLLRAVICFSNNGSGRPVLPLLSLCPTPWSVVAALHSTQSVIGNGGFCNGKARLSPLQNDGCVFLYRAIIIQHLRLVSLSPWHASIRQLSFKQAQCGSSILDQSKSHFQNLKARPRLLSQWLIQEYVHFPSLGRSY